MEKEQSQSKFCRNGPPKITSASDYFWTRDRHPPGYRSFDAEDKTFLRIASHLYRWVDSITGITAQTFVDLPPIRKPYLQLLQYLHKEGLIQTYTLQEERYNDAPSFYQCTISGVHGTNATSGKLLKAIFGQCTGRDVNELLSKAIGEFLERYFLTVFRREKLLHGSPKSLKKRGYRIMDLAALAGFSKKQISEHPNRQWDEDSILYWEKAVRLSTEDEICVPAQLVYWNYELDTASSEPFIREVNTNGCGGMFTKEGAVLSGLYELIQRDAFLLYWLNGISPPKIDPESVPNKVFQNLVRESRRYGFEIHCLNTTLDTQIPSFVVAITDKSNVGPYFVCGGGCEANPQLALVHALEEAWATYYFVRNLPSFTLPADYQPFRSLLNQKERLRLAANPKAADRYEFFINGETKSFSENAFRFPYKFSSQKEELKAAIAQVECMGPGYEVYAYTHPHPILKKMDYAAARVIVERLVPLYLNESNAPLGAPRLCEVPIKLGHKAGKELNPWPHPFP